jgi:TPP-dependent indolepyruvate ferredoxin oxidoreductase alpha subunit
MKKELANEGLSVIIAVRECIETAKRKKRTDGAANTGGAV